MSYTILGLVLAMNVLLVVWKLRHPTRKLDGVVDGILLGAMFLVFKGSTDLLIIGTIGSLIISLYLLAFPIKYTRKVRVS